MKRSRIEILREIVQDHQAARIDGVLMDATTAQMMVAVYDGLDRPGGLFERKPEMRERFDTLPLARLVRFGWRVVGESERRDERAAVAEMNRRTIQEDSR